MAFYFFMKLHILKSECFGTVKVSNQGAVYFLFFNVLYHSALETKGSGMVTLGRIKKQSCFSSPPSSLLGAASLFFFFYKNADNALEIELKRSKLRCHFPF